MILSERDHSMARPTLYSQEILEKAQNYIQVYEKELGSIIPSIAGLSLYLDTARSTLYEWRDKHEEFSDILERLMTLQERILIEKGLIREFNPTMTKMMLTKHGYGEKDLPDHQVLSITYIVPGEDEGSQSS